MDFNPVVTSYGVITLNEGTHLFIDPNKTKNCGGFLAGVVIHPYDHIKDFLADLASRGVSTGVDSSQLNWGLFNIASAGKIVELTSPITIAKSIKNDVELNGIRNAHIRDGAALTAFLFWLESTVRSGSELVTECSAAEKLETFRRQMSKHVSPSFDTIAGYGQNGILNCTTLVKFIPSILCLI